MEKFFAHTSSPFQASWRVCFRETTTRDPVSGYPLVQTLLAISEPFQDAGEADALARAMNASLERYPDLGTCVFCASCRVRVYPESDEMDASGVCVCGAHYHAGLGWLDPEDL